MKNFIANLFIRLKELIFGVDQPDTDFENRNSMRPAIKSEEHLFYLDLGSFTSTVMIAPYNFSDSNLSQATLDAYLIKNENDEDKLLDGFPSAFYYRDSITEDKEPTVVFEYNPSTKEDLIMSAKRYFAEKCPLQKNVPAFKYYLVKIIKLSLEEFLSKREINESMDNQKSPTITEFKLTCPDLFIGNIRDGFIRHVYEAIKEVYHSSDSNNPNIKILLEAMMSKCDKNEDAYKSYINIVTDEGSTTEIWFLKQLSKFPHINLAKKRDREMNTSRLKDFYRQRSSIDENSDFKFAMCNLDIGGMTTDANIVLLKGVDSELGGDPLIEMLRKFSMSKKYGGENIRRNYQNLHKNNGNGKDEWWMDENYVDNGFSSRLNNIVNDQSEIYEKMYKEFPELGTLYYLVSGRPSKNQQIKKLIVEMVSSKFNRNGLKILPDNIIFTDEVVNIHRPGEYYRCDKIKDFEKVVTVLGNSYCSSDALKNPLERENIPMFLHPIRDNFSKIFWEPKSGEKFELTKQPDFMELFYNNFLIIGVSKYSKDAHVTEIFSITASPHNFKDFSIIIKKHNQDDKLNKSVWLEDTIYIENFESDEIRNQIDFLWSDSRITA